MRLLDGNATFARYSKNSKTIANKYKQIAKNIFKTSKTPEWRNATRDHSQSAFLALFDALCLEFRISKRRFSTFYGLGFRISKVHFLQLFEALF